MTVDHSNKFTVSFFQHLKFKVYVIFLKIDDFSKGMWMLVHLLYVSQPVGPVTSTVTSSILKTSIQKNKESDITGVLCQGGGLWMQILEGERSKVNHLYSAVKTDPRHKNVELLLMEDIKQRQYKQWSMALVHLSKDDPLIQMQHPEFDPYLATGKDALKLIDDLINMGKPIVPDLR